MIACDKCGNQNPLGRVFCVACGAKLHLTAVTKEHVERKVTKWYVPLFRFFTRLFVVLIIAAVVLAALALWPNNTAKPGDAGTTMDSKSAREAFARARLKTRGVAPKPVKVTEKQLNAYFAQSKLKILGAQAMVVNLEDDAATLRITVPFKQSDPLTDAPQKPSPFTVSADIACTVVDNAFRVNKVTVGHLPLPGPMGSLLLDRVADALAEDKDWMVVTTGFQKLSVTADSISATPKP